MKRVLLFVLILIGPHLFSQETPRDKVYFSQILSEHLADYNRKADLAYRFRDYEKAKKLFDSLTSNFLEGSYMDNFGFYDLKKKEVHLYDYKKPVFLITYASWCIPGKGEIPALNKLASELKDKIDFVVLYWDTHTKAKEMAKQFDSAIHVVYVDESANTSPYVIKQLKHSLGLPTCFLLSGNKEITGIRRSIFPGMQTDEETAFTQNYMAMETSINNDLIKTYTEYAENVSLED
ncbi:thioredoxin [Christiangramia fulva]|uniref:Thioredoxin n=1 Tax=Christiangramia fulva TaxID=2126553 RepID=A0A2R3Z8Z5_9FLAO|nr:redoxin domain-containing protein [Christiangramia fulva]AVR46672.1 thioredoxin [Christiangramia fulva]